MKADGAKPVSSSVPDGEARKVLERLMDAAITAGLPRHSPAYQAALDYLAREDGTGRHQETGHVIYWTGSEDDQHRELERACKARCKQWGKDDCPRPDHYCAECESDMAMALRTTDPGLIEEIKNDRI